MTSAAGMLAYAAMIEDEYARRKVTVLRRPSCTWDPNVIDSLKVLTGTEEIEHRKDHPSVIMIMGEFTRDQITIALRSNDFGYEVVQGSRNPSLPFKPDW